MNRRHNHEKSMQSYKKNTTYKQIIEIIFEIRHIICVLPIKRLPLQAYRALAQRAPHMYEPKKRGKQTD